MDAAPNLHPLMVHFPIVLLLAALLLEVAARVRPWSSHQRWCTGAWLLAAISATAAFLSGRAAADGIVGIPATVQPALSEHADLAQLVLILAWSTAVLKLGQGWLQGGLRTAAGVLVLLVGLGANGLLVVAADHGGALVYQHGLAVAVPACPDCAPPPTAATVEDDASAELALTDDGTTLTWTVGPGQLELLGASSWPAEGSALAVDGIEELLLPGVFGDVQVNAWLDLGAFLGTVRVLHHMSEEAAGAFSLETVGSARLETLAPEPALLDEGPAPLPAEVLSVNVAGTHLKGMVDGKVVAHSHTAALPPGRVGLRFEGTGVIGVQSIEAVRLDASP